MINSIVIDNDVNKMQKIIAQKNPPLLYFVASIIKPNKNGHKEFPKPKKVDCSLYANII